MGNLPELVILALTGLVTLFTALYIAWQTHRHFQLQRSTHFIERFNGGDLHQMRIRVDEFVRESPDWNQVLNSLESGTLSENEIQTVYATRVIANFFQELATALKHKTLDKDYVWDVFGGLVKRYWNDLKPYVAVVRERAARPTLFDDFEALVREMEAIDAKKIG